MKIIFSFLLASFLLAIPNAELFGQNNEITIILLRHAEKDLSAGADKTDPELSAEGKRRAERFFETIKKHRPDYIYSSNFKRTLSTVTPLAENLNPQYRIQIQKYDHTELEDFADRLRKLNGRTIVVAGHNTTTPKLANLLVKQDKYKYLEESEYDKIWIIKIRKNRIRDVVIEY